MSEHAAEPTRTERELLLRGRQVTGLAEFARFSLAGHDLPELFDTAVRVVTEALSVPLAAVFEPVPGSHLVLLRSGAGWLEGAVGSLIPPVEPTSAIARVLAHGTAVTDDAPFAGGRGDGIPVLKEHRVASGAAVALPGSAGPQGVLAAYATERRIFKAEDVHFLQAVATLLAGAIDRRTTEQGLFKSQLRLQSVQKMEAIGRLAGGIAHDFNNLVQAIGGYTDLLLRRIPEHDLLHRHVEEIKKAGDRAAALTRQLLAFSRQQVMQPKVLQINSVVRNVESLLRRLIGEDVELETALSPDLGAVRADAAQLEQVLMNLAVNSRDAMPEGGTLTIETRNVVLTRSDQREGFVVNGGSYVLLSVADTGHGMDAEIKARAFDPFFTTKPPGRGTGLGLSTVYGIVKQSEGYIWVDSEPGRGTRVRIYLPRVDEPVEQEVRRPARAAAGPGGSETLLLVEDEEGVRDVIGEWLASHGYTVLAAANGTEALALAGADGRRIDLLIADVVMPQLGGPALAERLLQARPGLRVIYVSGYADEAIGDPRVLAAGSAFLQKPFALDTLLRKVREILDAP